MSSRNFNYLKKEWPELHKLTHSAEQNIHDDPNIAILKLRQFCENICVIILQRNNISKKATKTMNQVERLKLLSNKELVPKDIYRILNNIRKKGNLAAHDNLNSHTEAAEILKDTYKLALWLMENYSARSSYVVFNFEFPEKEKKPVKKPTVITAPDIDSIKRIKELEAKLKEAESKLKEKEYPKTGSISNTTSLGIPYTRVPQKIKYLKKKERELVAKMIGFSHLMKPFSKEYPPDKWYNINEALKQKLLHELIKKYEYDENHFILVEEIEDAALFISMLSSSNYCNFGNADQLVKSDVFKKLITIPIDVLYEIFRHFYLKYSDYNFPLSFFEDNSEYMITKLKRQLTRKTYNKIIKEIQWKQYL